MKNDSHILGRKININITESVSDRKRSNNTSILKQIF